MILPEEMNELTLILLDLSTVGMCKMCSAERRQRTNTHSCQGQHADQYEHSSLESIRPFPSRRIQTNYKNIMCGEVAKMFERR